MGNPRRALRHDDHARNTPATNHEMTPPQDVPGCVQAAIVAQHQGQIRQSRLVDRVPGEFEGIRVSLMAGEGLLSGMRIFGNPPHTRAFLLFDGVTRALLAIMDYGILNSLRVGATAGLAARYLAPRGARVMGLLGSGWQAPPQVYAMCRAIPTLERIRVWSPTRAHREAFGEEMTRRWVGEGIGRRRMRTISWTRGHDRQPLFDTGWVKPGALVISMAPNQYTADFVQQARVVAASWETLAEEPAPRPPYDMLIERGAFSRNDVTPLGAVIVNAAIRGARQARPSSITSRVARCRTSSLPRGATSGPPVAAWDNRSICQFEKEKKGFVEMKLHLVLRGLAVFGTVAGVAALAVSAVAQTAPVRVIQGSDGTLYLVRGGNAWTLVPELASDADVAALSPSGEVDGSIPNDLLVVPAPAAPAVAAPPTPQPVAAPAPTAVPPASPRPAAITGTVDLTGTVASDLPGTPIAVGATIMSMVDMDNQRQDVFSMNLSAGVAYQFLFASSNKFGNGQLNFQILSPDSKQVSAFGLLRYAPGLKCDFWNAGASPCLFTPTVSGTYYPGISTGGSPAQRYTITVQQVP